MRPTSTPDSYLRNPLDQILGYPGNIQLLRTLLDSGRGMSTSEISERTGLSVPGIHKIISRLLETGVVQREGSGRTSKVFIRKDHPLTPILNELFQTERNNSTNLFKKLKKCVDELEVKPKSVWIYGKVAKGTDDYGDPLQIAIYGHAKNIDELTEKYKERFIKDHVENDFDVTIEVRGVTSAEVDLIKEPDKIMIWGFDPSQLYSEQSESKKSSISHQELDARSLNDVGLWVDFLKKHPEVIERTKTNLKEKIQSEQSGVRKELQEWYRLLESMSFQRLRKFMESDSERSTKLRQSLPFWPVLTEAERKDFKSMANE